MCNQSSVCNCTNKNRPIAKSESSFESNVCNTSNNSSVTDVNTWHKRLGYTSKLVLCTVLKAVNCNTDVNILLFRSDCAIGNFTNFIFPKLKHTRAHFDLIHSDLWGPSPNMSVDGYKYYIHFVDDYTRFTWIFPIKTKNETCAIVTRLNSYIER